MFTDFFNWLIEYIFDLIDQLLSPIADMIPDMQGSYSVLANFVNYINAWIALDYALLLIALFLSIVCAVIVVKWILGLIPFIN